MTYPDKLRQRCETSCACSGKPSAEGQISANGLIEWYVKCPDCGAHAWVGESDGRPYVTTVKLGYSRG